MLAASKALGLLLTPPGLLLALALLGLVLQRRWRALGLLVTTSSLVTLAVLSSHAVGVRLMQSLEAEFQPLPPSTLHRRADPGAIVVLGGGRLSGAIEYGGDTVSSFTLERLRYGARLHRATGWPMLVTGGSVFGDELPEGELMRRTLIEDFGVIPQWVEARSRTTYENALYSRAILEAAGIRRILLVTHAGHLPRARWAFAQAGLEVEPAGFGFTQLDPNLPVALAYLPSAHGLALSSRALRERLGLLAYRLRARGDGVATSEQATAR